MKISIELDLIVRELNIPVEVFEKWKVANLATSMANGVPLKLSMPQKQPEMLERKSNEEKSNPQDIP